MREQFNRDFVGEDRKSNVETFHQTSLHSTIVFQTPEEFEGVDLETNQNVYVHQIVVDEEPQAAMLSIPEIEAVEVDAQSDGEKIEEIQDIGQSIFEIPDGEYRAMLFTENLEATIQEEPGKTSGVII